jgi:hypothetical protein
MEHQPQKLGCGAGVRLLVLLAAVGIAGDTSFGQDNLRRDVLARCERSSYPEGAVLLGELIAKEAGTEIVPDLERMLIEEGKREEIDTRIVWCGGAALAVMSGDRKAYEAFVRVYESIRSGSAGRYYASMACMLPGPALEEFCLFVAEKGIGAEDIHLKDESRQVGGQLAMFGSEAACRQMVVWAEQRKDPRVAMFKLFADQNAFIRKHVTTSDADLRRYYVDVWRAGVFAGTVDVTGRGWLKRAMEWLASRPAIPLEYFVAMTYLKGIPEGVSLGYLNPGSIVVESMQIRVGDVAAIARDHTREPALRRQAIVAISLMNKEHSLSTLEDLLLSKDEAIPSWIADVLLIQSQKLWLSETQRALLEKLQHDERIAPETRAAIQERLARR